MPTWLIAFTVDESLRRGLPLVECLEGTGLTLEALSNPQELVDWDALVEVAVRLADRGVTTQDLIDIYSQSSAHPVLRPIAHALQRLPDPASAYELLVRTNLTLYFRALRHRREPAPPGRLCLHFEVVEGVRFHPLLWSGIEGWLRGLPVLLGCAATEVESQLSERSALFQVQLPEERPWLRRMQLTLLGWLGSSKVLDQMVLQQTLLSSTHERLRAAHTAVERQAEALREGEARYRSMIDNATDLILVLDGDARILMASPSARRLMELDARVRRPVHALAFVHEDDRARARQALDALMLSHPRERLELRVQTARGRVLWIEASGRRIPSARGRDQLVVVGRDVTAQREAEHQDRHVAEKLEEEVQRRTHELRRATHELREIAKRVVHAEKAATTQELAGSVAHAINNPLAALTGYAELLHEQQSEPDPSLDRVLRLAARIRNVVDRTLQLSRQGVLNLSLESPAAILREVRQAVEGRAESRDVRVVVRVEPKLPTLFADRPLLCSALAAIAENAIDASSAGQVVRMQARTLPGMRVVEFRFEDTGTGLSEEAERRMFEPYFSTKSGATGLGLSVACGVVRGHEGRLRFEHRSGGGTIVTVELPFYVANQALPERTRRLVAKADPSS